jgi:hypothetical protein
MKSRRKTIGSKPRSPFWKNKKIGDSGKKMSFKGAIQERVDPNSMIKITELLPTSKN